MEQTLQFAGLALQLCLAIKLWATNLASTYRWLFAYTLFGFVRSGWPLLAQSLGIERWDQSGYLYSYWWAFTEPIQWVFLVVLVLELCSAIFHQFPALATFGGKIYRVALATAIALSLGSLFLSGMPDQNVALHILLAVQRVVLTSLSLVVLALLFSLTWFRVDVKKNTLVHAMTFFTYFFAKAGIVFILQTVGLEVRSGANVALAVISDLCFLAWIVGLRPAGEHVAVRVGHRWNSEEGERLVQQLAKLNDSLASRESSGRGVRSIPSGQ